MELNQIHLPLYCAGPITSFLPYLDTNELTLVDELRFPKHAGYRNRIEFVGNMGKQSFSLPLQASTRKNTYQMVELSYQEHWQNQLINALKSAYGRSPFFEYYDYRIEAVIRKDHQYLWALNFELLELILNCLKIEARPNIVSAQLDAEDVFLAIKTKPYYQVFAQDIGFTEGLSILDLLFNEGVDAHSYLLSLKNK